MRTSLLGGISLLLLAACSAVNRPEHPVLAVKTGLWEVTSGINEKETIRIPQSYIDRMTPEQRADYEQILREDAKHPATSIFPICVTAADLETAVFNALLWLPDSRCKVTITSATAQHREAEVECKTAPDRSDIRYLEFDAPTTEVIRGKVIHRETVTKGVSDMNGKWVGATCDVPTYRRPQK